MKITIIIFFALVLLIYINIKLNKKHKFWDKQPVSRDTLKKEGIISNNPKMKILLDNKMYFKNLDINNDNEFKIIYNFINSNFSDNYNYTKNFLKETLNYLGKVFNIGLYNNNEIIGFIHAKPIRLFIKNNILNMYYVDYLCVKKYYRGKNIPKMLISK